MFFDISGANFVTLCVLCGIFNQKCRLFWGKVKFIDQYQHFSQILTVFARSVLSLETKDNLIKNATSYGDCADWFSDHYTLHYLHTYFFPNPVCSILYIKNINNHNKVFIFNQKLGFVATLEIFRKISNSWNRRIG